MRNLSDIDGYSSMQSMRVTISESVISWWSHDLSVISDIGEEANTHSVISFVVGWSYFIVSWIEFDKTSGGLPTSPNRSSSNAAALESNRCLNMVYGQGHADRAMRTGTDCGRSRTYLTTRLSSLLTASVSSLFIPDASLGVSGSNHLELAGDWNRYFLIKWDSRAKIIILIMIHE